MRTPQKILLGAVCLAITTGCSNTPPIRAAGSNTQTTSVSPTTITSVSTTTVTVETTMTEVSTAPLPSSSKPQSTRKLPATFNSVEDWVVRVTLFFFPHLEGRKNELVRRVPQTITCGNATVNSADAYDKHGLIWCGKPTARKFYFSYSTLDRLRTSDVPAGQALIIRGLAAYALDESSTPGQLNDQAIAQKAGALVREVVCDGRIAIEEAQGLAPGFGAQSNVYLKALGSCK